MKWFTMILSYTVKSFFIFFIIISLYQIIFLGIYAKIKSDVFRLYFDYEVVFFFAAKISLLIFFTVTLHVILVQIPSKRKKRKSPFKK